MTYNEPITNNYENQCGTFPENSDQVCPISQEPIIDKYKTKCGHIFEKEIGRAHV